MTQHTKSSLIAAIIRFFILPFIFLALMAFFISGFTIIGAFFISLVISLGMGVIVIINNLKIDKILNKKENELTDREKTEKKKILREIKIKEIKENINLPQGFGDDDFFLDNKKGSNSTITIDEIIKRLGNKEATPENLDEIIDHARELAKIREREKKVKIREKAEKEYYGKSKTKRKSFDSTLKDAVYSKYNNECAICGATQGLHIHHRDNNPKNNKLNNLILLCGVCHKKSHMKVR